MYGTLAGMWYLEPGSKSISDLNTGGFIPPYCSLQKITAKTNKKIIKWYKYKFKYQKFQRNQEIE